MTEQPDAEAVTSRRDAVLWMWKAHNQARLCMPAHYACRILAAHQQGLLAWESIDPLSSESWA